MTSLLQKLAIPSPADLFNAVGNAAHGMMDGFIDGAVGTRQNLATAIIVCIACAGIAMPNQEISRITTGDISALIISALPIAAFMGMMQLQVNSDSRVFKTFHHGSQCAAIMALAWGAFNLAPSLTHIASR